MKHEEGHATIREITANDSIRSAKDEVKADLYIKTGKTGGKRFLVSINHEAERPTLVALHL